MATPILIPKLSFVVTQGTIVEWLKAPGDTVIKGEHLLIIESEKATVEVESPGSGLLGPDLAPPGTTVPVTTTIGYILEPGEDPPELALDLAQPAYDGVPAATGEERQETKAEVKGKREGRRRVKASPSARRLAREQGIDLADVQGTGPEGRIVKEDVLAHKAAQAQAKAEGRVRVSPVARKLAAELGVDLDTIAGTGPGGRIRREDVERAAQSAPGPAVDPSTTPVELTSIQRITAERMAASFGTAPHFYLSVEADMSQAATLRAALLPDVEARTGIRLSYTDILLCAVGRALREHPALNASFQEGQGPSMVSRFQDVNLCLAVDTPHGLTVPVLHQADRLSLEAVAQRRAELVDRAQDNRLTPEDLQGGTFTVSNLGMFGIDLFSAIINPPQAAILAAGRIAKRPVVVDDELALRTTIWLTLSVDHRVADGATAARFLQTLVGYLEAPSRMLL